MANYKKRYTKKHTPRGGRAKSYFGRSISTGFKLAKLATTVYALKGLVNSEMLHVIQGAANTVTSSGTIVHCTSLSQDDSSSGRTGNSILAKSLYIKFRATINTNAAANNTLYRILIIQDTLQQADTTPSVANILNSDVMSGMNAATAGRFKILKSLTKTLTWGINNQQVFNEYIKLHTHIKYNGSANTDIQRNGIYILMISDQATYGPSITYNYNLGYHDN